MRYGCFVPLLPGCYSPLDCGLMAGFLAPMLIEMTNFRYYSKDGREACQMKPRCLRGHSWSQTPSA